MKTASIRDLRTQFPRVRRLLEQEGEIVVTDGQLRLAPKLKVSFKSAGQAENRK